MGTGNTSGTGPEAAVTVAAGSASSDKARGNSAEALLAPKLINPGIFIALDCGFCNGTGFPFSDRVDTSTIAGLYKYPATEKDFAFPLDAV